MNNPNVLGFLAAPSREDSLRAISLALLRVRSNHRISCAELGKLLECSDDTIQAASNEKGLLSFDSVSRLGHFFPDEFTVVEELWGKGVAPPTVEERLRRIDRELAALRREVAEQ